MGDADERSGIMIVDAYAHVGLPRFQSVADYRRTSSPHGVERAVLCSFSSSPDLAAVHDAIVAEPGRFRGIGVPLGTAGPMRLRLSIAQLDGGFSGLRLTESDLVDAPDLLAALGERSAIAVLAGCGATPRVAERVLAALRDHPGLTVVAVHFAGGGRPEDLTGEVAELAGHPRFHVVFSRHGGFPEASLVPWAAALVETVGWDRLLWGSESPLLFWRDESLASAIAWADRFAPTPREREAFLGGNASQLFFDGVPARPAPLELDVDPAALAEVVPAGLFAHGVAVPQEIAGRLVADWVASGSLDGLGAHLSRLLDSTLPPLPRSPHEKAIR